MESNAAILSSNTNEQIKRHLLYISRMAQQRGFRQRNCCRALANREKCISCDSFNVQQSCSGVRVSRNKLVETSSSSCLVICRRAFGVAADGFGCLWKWNSGKFFFFVSVSSSRTVATLHITFCWLPLPIGQVCSQVRCRPYLAAHFGFFDLRTFPRLLSEVQVSTFYPFTLKVGSKCTYITLISTSVKPSNNNYFCEPNHIILENSNCSLEIERIEPLTIHHNWHFRAIQHFSSEFTKRKHEPWTLKTFSRRTNIIRRDLHIKRDDQSSNSV